MTGDPSRKRRTTEIKELDRQIHITGRIGAKGLFPALANRFEAPIIGPPPDPDNETAAPVGAGNGGRKSGNHCSGSDIDNTTLHRLEAIALEIAPPFGAVGSAIMRAIALADRLQCDGEDFEDGGDDEPSLAGNPYRSDELDSEIGGGRHDPGI